MSLRVVDQDLNDRQGTVTLESPTQQEVMSPAAKQLAIKVAMSAGLNRAGVSGQEVAYPVDEHGETGEDLILGRGGSVAAYRCDYRVTGGL